MTAWATQAATVSWIGGSGDWNTVSNWSTGALPGSDDDVLIGAGSSITVTHSSGTHAVKSIQSQQAFVLSGGLLTVSNTVQVNSTFTLAGGSLVQATVLQGTNGASFVVNVSGTLDGVTVNGMLDVGNTVNGAQLTVTNGLGLNGTALMGNPTNQWPGNIIFTGSQTLSGNGTVVFGLNGYNALWLDYAGTTLTIGSGITVRGQNGGIGAWSGYPLYGPANVSVINRGIISADVAGGQITINAQPFSNQGLAQGINGGTLLLGGTWNNGGTLVESGGAIYLGGNFTVANVGTVNRTNGTIYISGTLTNTGTTLTLNAVSGSWALSGGTILGGTVAAGNGASLVVSSGTLDGVAVNGVLDVGNTYSAAQLTVTNGLGLNGTALVGNPTNQWPGNIIFAGSQTLSGNGTVVFGLNGYNALWLDYAGTTLTIGSGITVRGQNGGIGAWSGYPLYGPANVSVINRGIISADVAGGQITTNAQPFSNQGLAQGINGGTLSLGGAWDNMGTLVESGGAIYLGGNFTVANVGTVNRTNGTIYISGTLTNTGTTLTLNAVSGSWALSGGTILGGTVAAGNGASLVVSSGTLDGVAVNGVLDVGNTYSAAQLTVTNGLVLNGTALVGNPTNQWPGNIILAGSQTLSGNGTVVFGLNGYNALWLDYAGTTLTIGSGITVRGQNGGIGAWSGYPLYGPANVSVINWGIISADVAGGQITINAQPFSNQGLAQGINGGTLSLGGAWNNMGTLVESGGAIYLGGNFTVANVGTVNRTNGAVYISGTLTNTGTTLTLNAASGSWALSGGTILGGTVSAGNGVSLTVSSGTLDGVTVNGVLDVGNTVSGAQLTVTNGLGLNGTALVGNPTNQWPGNIIFAGSQTLSGNGTVVFGLSGYNALWLDYAGTTLTIGSGITMRGQNGGIGAWSGYPLYGPANVSVINRGIISADVAGGQITINAQPFSNQGLAQGINGGTLLLGGTWNNGGTLVESGGAIYLGGNFTVANVGTVNRTNGTIYISGTLTNTGTTLTLNAVSGSWALSGGTILGGTVAAGNGASLVVSSGTLDGVAVNGVLDVGNTYSAAQLTVTNGLVLNGTALVGNPTNQWPGNIILAGSQTLSGNGTVVFGLNGYNALWLDYAGTTLTIGSGITVRGQNGGIGAWSGYPLYGPANVSVINWGIISADVAGGQITINAQPFSNQGLAQGINGGTLSLGGAWNNMGTLVESGGAIYLGGNFTVANVGTVNRTNGAVYISGTLTNTGTTLTLNAASGSWALSGGTILGGTVSAGNGVSLTVSSGTLDGVTVNGVLDVGNTVSGAQLTVTNGLGLNGTALVGNPTNQWPGNIIFAGSQTLSGNGTVVFGLSGYNALWLDYAGTTLTIGSGITMRGQNGGIGAWSGYPLYGPANVSVINRGIISADVAGGQITINAQPFSNQGLAQGINGGTLSLGGAWDNMGTLVESGGAIYLGGNFTVANVGTVNRTNGAVYISGTLTNTGTTLTLNAASGSWALSGGTILGGTVAAGNGASLVVSSGTLDGVTVNGVLDVGNTYNANLTVTNGLVLNGTALVGNTNYPYGAIGFAGSQTLSGNGTVVFGGYNGFGSGSANALYLAYGGTTLTLGPGITVRGQTGMIGAAAYPWNSPANVALINQGIISADVSGGTIIISAQPFTNQGLAQGINGGALALIGAWNNSGTLVESGGNLNLEGNFTLANVGTLNRTNGTIYVNGTLTNTGTLTLNAASGSWVLQGGTIIGGSVTTTGGASLIVSGSGTLDGVTVNGVLDVGNTYNANLTVTNGLVLNGTALVGNTNYPYGAIGFAGSQTLSGNGTVVFGGYNGFGSGSANALYLAYGGTTLTLGPGITVRGQTGMIGAAAYPWNSPANVALINQGIISADVSGGTIIISAQPFSNQGLAQGINGGTLALTGTWNNSGTLVESGGNLNLEGNFTMANVGTLNRTNGTIYVNGTLTNTGTALTLNAASGSWVLQGGTILGGSVTTTGGGSLIVSGSGTLDGVTVNGVLDVGNTYSANLTVTNGLVLNGTALVGNTNYPYGAISFAGSQTLGGNGTVVFGGYNGWGSGSANALHLAYSGTTLTLGPGITVRGQTGMIGAAAYPWNSPANVALINQGTISADVAGGQITINAQPFSNQGNVTVSAGATLSVTAEAAFNDPSALLMQAGGTLQIGGDFLGNTRNVDQWLPQGTLSFTSGAHQMEAMSLDVGNVPNGYVHNFAYGTISLASGAQVTLVDQSTNSAGPPPECVYATSLIVPSGSTLNLNGFHLYARLTQIGGTVTGGAVSQTPDIGGPLTLGNSAPGTISAAGALEEFTFLGRSGEHVAVSVDTGSASVLPPPLTYAFVQLFDPSTNLMAQASNTVPQQVVGLVNVILPVDGTYTVAVRAPANQSASTGNYLVTLWDTTPRIASLVVNQQEYGQITTPFSVDQWNFSASADEQVEFSLINAAAPGIAFDLSGPNGWVGFSNLVTSSGLVTLPYDGNYALTAFGTGGAYGFAYTFELVQTAETNLAVGSTFSGSFVGNGQAQLIAVNLTNGSPLLITLNNAGANNVTELYAQLGSPPTRGTFGYESIHPASPNQQILIPNANGGTYYILIYGNQISTPGSYTVQVLAGSVFLTSVTPNLGPNNAALTLTLNGVGFLPSTGVQLISTNGASFHATSATADSFTRMTATFASNALPAGVYSVKVSGADGGSATLTNSFVVSSQGAATFVSSLSLPYAVRIPRIPAMIYPQFANTGDAPMPAPLLVLTATAEENGRQDALLTLDGTLLARGIYSSAQPAGFTSSAQFLASGQIPGFLEPGESFQVPVYWAGWLTPLTPHTYLDWNLGVIQANDPTPLDWSSLEYSLEPPTIPADAWNAIYMAFTNQVGSTWGSYVTMLDNNSAYLGRLGLNVTDISKLLAFQFMQDDGLCPLRTLASSVDAAVPAPGLPLTFRRSFGERISQRYAMGPLGRGWSHNWQYSLQVGSDGTVTIFGPGGSQRVFQPDTRGINYFAQAGDYGKLTLAIDAMPPFTRLYTLTEKSGLSFMYGAGGKLQYVQDPNQNRIFLGYTGSLLTSLTHSSGQNIQLAYNAAGLIQTITDQFGHQTVLTYDAANQHLIGAQYYDGRNASYAYDTTGPATVLHALLSLRSSGVSRDFSYDPLGRLALVSMGVEPGPGGNGIPIDPVTFSYGVGGQVTVTDALGNPTQFFYDHRGLLAKTVDALGNAVQLTYDNNYSLLSVTDPTGRLYNYGYDSSGNLTQSIDPLGDISHFRYTSTYNRLASVTDAKGNATEYGYDADANLQSINYADGSIESRTYDSYGNPQTWTNRRGHQTIYTNNNYGQITAKRVADGSLVSYAYDAQHNLTSAATFNTNQSPLELSTMAYDGGNRLVEITYPGGKYLTFAYDSNGRRTSSVDQLGHQLNYTYDGQGRLRSMTNELNALVVQYQYDPDGRVATKTLGNGMFTTYQYDPAGELLSKTNALPNGAVLSSFKYAYDSRGRRTSMNSLDGQWAYTYDDIGQLTHAVFVTATTNIANQDLAYAYDALGNRIRTIENGVTTSYRANNLNQYVTVGTTNFTFDADGNLIKEVSSNGTVTYTYNDENRVIAMTSPQGSWQYTYDGLQGRTVITANGTATRDVIDPIGLGNVVGEYDASGNLIAHYDQALGLVSRIDASGNWAGYACDAIGNVQQMVSPAGAILNSYAYKPFGGLLRDVGVTPNPFQFIGQLGIMNDGCGVYSMRHRYFSPDTGRFNSDEPLGVFGGNVNLYAYGFNNPVSFVDVNGRNPILFGAFLGFAGYLLVKETEWAIGGYKKFDGTWVGFGSAVAAGALSGGFSAAPFAAELAAELGPITAGFSQVVVGFGSAATANMADTLGGANNPPWQALTAGVGGIVGPVITEGEVFSQPAQQYIEWQFGFITENTLNFVITAVSGGSGTTIVGTATDPNGLTGPAGYAVQNYVIESNVFDYEIFFENETNATSPAQIVQITDPLSTNVDWQSFQLAEIGFGNTLISIPPNIQHFQTNMPFTFSNVSFQVQIEAGINLANGQVFANFFSIDPLTGLPPEGEVGFLPPEDGTGRGKGQVSYTVRPTSGLPEGTRIPNVAYIQFDQNPVIATDQVNDNDPSQGVDTNKQAIVTIDNIAPVSSVSTLPAIETNANFTVCWSGTDVGSGVVSYDIWVSTNSGPWTVWLAGATNTCAMFNGQNGNTYGFNSVAHDGAGNAEPRHVAADTTTAVQAGTGRFTAIPYDYPDWSAGCAGLADERWKLRSPDNDKSRSPIELERCHKHAISHWFFGCCDATHYKHRPVLPPAKPMNLETAINAKTRRGKGAKGREMGKGRQSLIHSPSR